MQGCTRLSRVALLARAIPGEETQKSTQAIVS